MHKQEKIVLIACDRKVFAMYFFDSIKKMYKYGVLYVSCLSAKCFTLWHICDVRFVAISVIPYGHS